MAPHHHGTLVPQDTSFDNADQPGIAQPYSQSEIEDLLFGDERPASERLARLRDMRDEASTRDSGDFGDADPAALLDEIDRAIDELSASLANSDEESDFAGLESTYMRDPADHLDALSPDDEDARDALTGEDAFYDDDEDGPADDDNVWPGSEEFRHDKH